MNNVIVWDIETVPDLKGFAATNGHAGKSDDEVRAELGDKFPTRSFVSVPWSPVARMAVAGLWMRSEHRTSESDPRRS